MSPTKQVAGKKPAGKAPAKTASKKAPGGETKKRTKKRTETYSTYIYKVLKQVYSHNYIDISGSPRHWNLQQGHVDYELVR
jgi:hypothetical protein